MTAKEYLEQAYKLDRQINSHLEEVRSLRELATGLSSPAFGEKVQSSVSGDASFVKTVESIIRMENRVNKEIDQLVALKEQIHNALLTVSNPRERMILRGRYIDGKSEKYLAADLDLDVRTIRRLHKHALENMVLPENPIIV